MADDKENQDEEFDLFEDEEDTEATEDEFTEEEDFEDESFDEEEDFEEEEPLLEEEPVLEEEAPTFDDMDVDGYMNEIRAAMEPEGLHLPDTTNPKEFIKHLVTAWKTHAATRDLADNNPEEETFAMSGGDEIQSENAPMMMSALRFAKECKDDPIKIAFYKNTRADKKKVRLSIIRMIEQTGLVPPKDIEELKARANLVRLSLVTRGPHKGDVVMEPIDYELRAYRKVLQAHKATAKDRKMLRKHPNLKQLSVIRNPSQATEEQQMQIAEEMSDRIAGTEPGTNGNGNGKHKR